MADNVALPGSQAVRTINKSTTNAQTQVLLLDIGGGTDGSPETILTGSMPVSPFAGSSWTLGTGANTIGAVTLVTSANVSINAGLPTGANTIGAVSVTGGLPTGANTIGAVTVSGTVSVTGGLPTGTNTIGSVGVTAITGGLPTGANTIGAVTLISTANVSINAGLPTGANTIGAVASINAGLPSGSNTIGNIGTISTLTNGLPTGANTIGAVNLNVGGITISASNPIPIIDAYLAPVTTTWVPANTVGTVQTVNTNGFDTVIVTIVSNASVTGGQLIFEVYDGVNWLPIKAPTIIDYTTVGTITLTASYSKGFQVPVAGFPQFRVRIAAQVSGTGGSVAVTTIVSSAPDVSLVTVGLDPASTLPGLGSGSNTIGAVSVTGGLPTGANTIGAVTVSGTVSVTGGLPTGANTIGSVGVTAITGGLPTGANTIGAVTLLSTANVSINAGLPTGANTIGSVGVTAITGGLPTGANTIGSVASIIGGLPAGTNNIGIITQVNNPVGAAGINTSQVTVGLSSVLLTASRTGSVGTGRVSCTIYNNGSAILYIGQNGVTTLTGFPIVPGASLSIYTTAALYGISTITNQTIGILETF